jgi:hypothetical protein
MQGKTRQDKTRQEMTRQDKTIFKTQQIKAQESDEPDRAFQFDR